jgi:hypothetical protein
MRTLKLMPEYLCKPLWLYEEGSEIPRNVTPYELDLSEELEDRIAAFDAQLQATFDPARPYRSGFLCESMLMCHWLEGDAIAHEIAREIGAGVVVSYERTGEIQGEPTIVTPRRSLRAA